MKVILFGATGMVGDQGFRGEAEAKLFYQEMHLIDHLIVRVIRRGGDPWQGIDVATGFQLVKRPDGRVLRIADLVDDDAAKHFRRLATEHFAETSPSSK